MANPPAADDRDGGDVTPRQIVGIPARLESVTYRYVRDTPPLHEQQEFAMTSLRHTLLAAVAFCLIATPALAERPNIGEMALDGFVVRPFSFVGAVASTGVFLGTLGFTAVTGTADDIAPYMVAAPLRFTFARHLGDYSNYHDGLDIRGYAKEAPGITRARRRSLD